MLEEIKHLYFAVFEIKNKKIPVPIVASGKIDAVRTAQEMFCPYSECELKSVRLAAETKIVNGEKVVKNYARSRNLLKDKKIKQMLFSGLN